MTGPARWPETDLAGWGRFPRGRSRLARPEQMEALQGIIARSPSALARGMGRSYGDAAWSPDGVTILLERLDRFLDFDPATGVLHCEAGVTIADLLEYFLPRGFLPPVTPGTKFVTLGGALACDVHGKSHHRDGSFSRHVLEFRLLTASGEILTCSRTENAELFWATHGGMGLTGIVTDLRLRLLPVESSYVVVDYDRAPDLDAALRLFHDSDDRYTHSVAWIDCLKQGRGLGRSVLMRGNWARRSDLPPRSARDPLALPDQRRITVPFDLPAAVLNPLTVSLFNAQFYARHRTAHGVVTSIEPFFYPLDRVRQWNRFYGRRGFLQYQFVVPHAGGREALIRILELLTEEGHASFLAVLKRFGEVEPEQLLSFPRPGYTLAVDLPRDHGRQDELLRRMDEVVVTAGGRVYLAKDARLGPDAFRTMYPEWARWLAIKQAVDPEGRFESALSRRLGMQT
ncbi:MAG: FAD-binding protein [Gemmatimonadales bacterium]